METNLNSGQIEITGPFGRVYLYTYKKGDNLISIVHNVLEKRVRWDDPDYLSRMLFCAMIDEDDLHGELDFGIGTQLYADVNTVVSVNTIYQQVAISSYDDENHIRSSRCSFEDFINTFGGDAEL
jgi:hypothetical protein